MARGCDYAWDRPNLQGLRAAGVEFACRYLSYDNTGKNLTRGEADALQANGIAVVSNWEYETDAALRGVGKGNSDARAALAQHNAVGGTPSAPIYFSVDFDASVGDMFAVQSYIFGCTQVLGHDRVGVYGGLRVIQHLQSINACRWFWQTSAWSRGVWQLGVHIRQYAYNQRIGGALVDLDQGMTDNYGQWNGSVAKAVSPPGGHEQWDFGGVIGDIGKRLNAMGNEMSSLAERIRAARR